MGTHLLKGWVFFFAFYHILVNEEDITMKMDPGPVNYGQAIISLKEKLNGLIGSVFHVKSEMDHMKLQIRDLERNNKELMKELEELKKKVK